MKFVVIEINDGGADDSIFNSVTEVSDYLRTGEIHWVKARRKLVNTTWRVGMSMKYPCGWIFCVSDTVYI